MPQEEKRFSAREIDAQFEQLAQSTSSPSETANSRVVESLQTLYGKEIQQEQQSLERIRQRLALSVAAREQEQQERADEHAAYKIENVPEEPLPLPLSRPRRSRPWLRGLEQCVAAILVLGIIAGWFALSHMPHSYNGSPAAFSDAHAQPLGAPITTLTGNFHGGVEGWSPDGHTLALLQVDTQKHKLIVRLVDVTTGHSTSYPVLDASWIPALNLSDPFQILMGRYLLALRADGKNQATMVIWDITGQHAVTTQTIPAQILGSGQVWLPWIVSSQNEQKLAVFLPDGTATIWDGASGQKLITCAGKVTYGSSSSQILPPIIKWYNHDQSLLFSPRETGRIVAWNTATGMRLFSRNDATTYEEPLISPDNNYLALAVGRKQTAGNVSSFHTNGLQILDAHSGQVLHSYQLNVPNNTGVGFTWLPDSQRLLTIYASYTSTASSTSSQSEIYTWNVFTNKKTLVTSFSQAPTTGSAAGPFMVTPDNQYVILSSPDGRTMEIWQTSNGQKIATVTTPGVYARTDSFFYVNKQQMVVGLKGDFDIWDLASGQLLYKYHGTTPFSMPAVDGSIIFWSPDGKYMVMMAGTSISIDNGMASIWRIP